MYEEKLSPTKPAETDEFTQDDAFENGKPAFDGDATHPAKPTDEEDDADAVRDEIEAKISGLNLNDGNNDHEKCMDTVRSQGETINTLIHQLRIMFDEFTSINNEREYYEELNEALFRCLELRDENPLLSERDDDLDDSSESSKNQNTEATTSTQTENDAAEEQLHMQNQERRSRATQASSSDFYNLPVNDSGDDEITEPKPKNKMTKREMQSINNVLLRELFELRHQMDVLKDCFRDYLKCEQLDAERDSDSEGDAPDQECELEMDTYLRREDDQEGIADEDDSD